MYLREIRATDDDEELQRSMNSIVRGEWLKKVNSDPIMVIGN